MRRQARDWLPALGLMAGIVALVGACGGSGDDPQGLGEQVTDPGRVPTSTPIGDAPKYEIRGDNVVLPAGTATGLPETSPTPSQRFHTVVSGDTCGAVASLYHITVPELRAANPGINENCTNLRVGEAVVIPGGTGPAPTQPTATAAPSGRTYTVASGDTCSAIAASYNVAVEDLRVLNGLNANCALQVGQVLQIP